MFSILESLIQPFKKEKIRHSLKKKTRKTKEWSEDSRKKGDSQSRSMWNCSQHVWMWLQKKNRPEIEQKNSEKEGRPNISIQLQAHPQVQSTRVSSHTIYCWLTENGLHGRKSRKTPLLRGRVDFAKIHIEKPQSFLENVLWTN